MTRLPLGFPQKHQLSEAVYNNKHDYLCQCIKKLISNVHILSIEYLDISEINRHIKKEQPFWKQLRKET